MAKAENRLLTDRAMQIGKLIDQGTNQPKAIIQAINQSPQWAYNRNGNDDPDAHQKALQQDLKRLHRMGHPFAYDKKTKGYVRMSATESSLPLAFTHEELTVLAQLIDLQQVTPFARAAKDLREKLVKQMPPEQRKLFTKRPLIGITIPAFEELTSHLETAGLIMKAYECQQTLSFLYQAPAHAEAYRYRVQVTGPVELRDGHAYFEARSLQSDREWDGLRLDRVVSGSAQLLPNKQPSHIKHNNLVPIRYWLAKDIGPSKQFPIDYVCETREDGHIISAKIDERDFFRATKILLRYGENCVVIDPPALLDEVRRAVEGMARHYGLLD